MSVSQYMESIFQSTPPARGATYLGWTLKSLPEISIHAPREGGDSLSSKVALQMAIFQSTPPARGATEISLLTHLLQVISIHAPREGGDLRLPTWPPLGQMKFQSTPPARGATGSRYSNGNLLDNITIHAPREGGDALSGGELLPGKISIHAPREGGDGHR